MTWRLEADGSQVRAVAPDGAEIGRARAVTELHGQPLAPGSRFVHLAVEEAHRGRGVGGALYQALLGLIGEASVLDCAVAAGDEAALGFATRRGFRFDYQILDAALDLARFDPAPFAGVIPAVEARGIRFTTLAESPHLVPALYELDRAASADIPQWSGFMPPFEQYVTALAESGSGGVHVALNEAGRPVGHMVTDSAGHTDFLCVARSHRGRGIALALKLLTIAWAKQHGISTLTTNNNAESKAILALNEKLGYTTTAATIYLVKSQTNPISA